MFQPLPHMGDSACDSIDKGDHITEYSKITYIDIDGLVEARPPNDEVRQILNVVKGQIQDKSGWYGDVELLAFRYSLPYCSDEPTVDSSVVGTTYFLKVKITEINLVSKCSKVLHARVFLPLPYTGAPASLESIDNKDYSDTVDSKINYF